MSGGRLTSPAEVSVTRSGPAGVVEAGGGLAAGEDADDADNGEAGEADDGGEAGEAGEEEPTAESRFCEDSEPEVERRRGRGGAAGRPNAAGMCSDAVITQLSSSDPPTVSL